MNQIYSALPANFSRARGQKITTILLVSAVFAIQICSAQAISGIITDYNGYWKSGVGALNAAKPQNDHNLLAFSYNGTTYSTGVNDGLLASNSETFISNDFWALPVASISGHVNGNTKIGLGQIYDGVSNGASNPTPSDNIFTYLTDGIKGLNIGTCIANLPAGYMTYQVNGINPASIGDGVPDIVVTQVADPSGAFDRYDFTNASGTVVGNHKDIVFPSIVPVGTWTADFYEASSHPIILTPGYTNTDRPIRLWAADLSEFGITAANYSSIRSFRINLSGTSDVAFVAYSTRSFSVVSILPVRITGFSGNKNGKAAELNWNTASEDNSAWFVIEKSSDNRSFAAIDSVKAAGNSNNLRGYSYSDNSLKSGANYYRLKMVDADGRFQYSIVVSIIGDKNAKTLTVYPNPVRNNGSTFLAHAKANGKESLKVYNMSGILITQQSIAKGSESTTLNLQRFTKGVYYIVLQNDMEKQTQKLLID
jgi:hypothetical protein